MKKNYEAFVFDLDGTLYYQKPFRKKMVLFLLTYLLCHPKSLKDILIVKKHRQVREHWDEYVNSNLELQQLLKEKDLDEVQAFQVAKLTHSTPERVKKAVDFFIMQAPLSLLPSYRDNRLASIIEQIHALKKPVIVYSDYPVEHKLKALGITATACFSSEDPEIQSMKPDPAGLRHIQKTLNLTSDQLIMIGDRYERDGLAAKNNNIDYLILDSQFSKRQPQLDKLEELLR